MFAFTEVTPFVTAEPSELEAKLVLALTALVPAAIATAIDVDAFPTIVLVLVLTADDIPDV